MACLYFFFFFYLSWCAICNDISCVKLLFFVISSGNNTNSSLGSKKNALQFSTCNFKSFPFVFVHQPAAKILSLLAISETAVNKKELLGWVDCKCFTCCLITAQVGVNSLTWVREFPAILALNQVDWPNKGCFIYHIFHTVEDKTFFFLQKTKVRLVIQCAL